MCFFIVLLDGFDIVVIGFIVLLFVLEWGILCLVLVFVLSVVFFGLVVGVFVVGLLLDWIGCCFMLIVFVLVFGVVCFVFVYVSSIMNLIVLCFVIGIGFGVVMLNVVILMSEFCFDKCCVVIVNLMFCGFFLGVVFGGFLVVWMILYFGWCSVFMLGGVVLLVLFLLLVLYLLEFVCYMIVRS